MRVKLPNGTVAYIDRFDCTSDIPKSRRTYEVIKHRVLETGRFSIFEATADDLNARLFTKLHADPELVLDNTQGYPWIYVRRAGADDSSKAKRAVTPAASAAIKASSQIGTITDEETP